MSSASPPKLLRITSVVAVLGAVAFMIGGLRASHRADAEHHVVLTPIVPASNAPPAVEGLPVFGALPAMSLTDQEGKPFTLDRMRGHVWIANFIFTSCPMACPLLSQRMSLIQTKIQPDPATIQLVSFSVDPSHDTPPVLKQYGTRYHQDPTRWTFVTGKPDEVLSIVSDGFKVAVEKAKAPPDPNGANSNFVVMHGENFVLIDRDGRIRGYYHKDDEDLDRLVTDARKLAQGNA
jgi:protein SCO1/2